MKVAEIVRLNDGREITVHVTEEELKALLSAGVNFLLAQGLLALDGIGTDERIGNEEVLEEMDATTEEAPEQVKH